MARCSVSPRGPVPRPLGVWRRDVSGMRRGGEVAAGTGPSHLLCGQIEPSSPVVGARTDGQMEAGVSQPPPLAGIALQSIELTSVLVMLLEVR